MCRFRAEREPHSDFLRTQLDRIGHKAVHPDDGQKERRAGQHQHDTKTEVAVGRRLPHHFRQALPLTAELPSRCNSSPIARFNACVGAEVRTIHVRGRILIVCISAFYRPISSPDAGLSLLEKMMSESSRRPPSILRPTQRGGNRTGLEIAPASVMRDWKFARSVAAQDMEHRG